MERAGMNEMYSYDRIREDYLYFKVPNDAPPPEG